MFTCQRLASPRPVIPERVEVTLVGRDQVSDTQLWAGLTLFT